MTYAELVTALQETLQSTEATFVSNIPNFVRDAEFDIYQNTQIPDLRKGSTGTLSTSNEYLSTPTDFLAPYSCAVVTGGTHYYLLNREVDFIREAYPSRTTTGRPKFYGLWDDDTFIVAPTPDAAYSVELHYFYRPTSIVTASTSWLGTNANNVLLYGSLVHGYIFLKGEPELLQYYKDEYLRALANLQVLTEGRARKDTYRTMNARMPV